MKITLSKSQWEKIGKKAGWIRKSFDNSITIGDLVKIKSDHIKPLRTKRSLGIDPILDATWNDNDEYRVRDFQGSNLELLHLNSGRTISINRDRVEKI